MLFTGEPFLPAPAAFPGYLASIREHLRLAGKQTPEEVLHAFFGRPVPPAAFHVDGVHHVAVYLGDYRREEDLERWTAFVSEADEVHGVRCGPSYIAPRHYGAPGYWINCRVAGAELEMFSCKHIGDWAGFDPMERRTRMSHLALSVADGAHVRPALEYLAHYPEIDLLAYTPADELGHTYGHLLHRGHKDVLELVHPGPA